MDADPLPEPARRDGKQLIGFVLVLVILAGLVAWAVYGLGL